MAEWKQVSDREWCLDAGSFRACIWEPVEVPGCHAFSIDDNSEHFDSIQATDAEAAKREAVALFRAKLEAALEEIGNLNRGPYIVVPMPIDSEGRGPEMDPKKQVKTLYEIWDATHKTVGSYESEEEAIEEKLKLERGTV